MTWVSEGAWEMSGVRAHSGVRPIRQNSDQYDRCDNRHNLQILSGHDQSISVQSDHKPFKTAVKSGSSPGQSLDEFQIKGMRMEGQRLA